MNTDDTYRFPAPRGGVAELTADQYDKLTGPGGLTASMLLRIAGAALLLDNIDPEEGRSLKKIVERLHDDTEIWPTNMERRAMVALVRAGLVEVLGQGNQTCYFRVGDPR